MRQPRPPSLLRPVNRPNPVSAEPHFIPCWCWPSAQEPDPACPGLQTSSRPTPHADLGTRLGRHERPHSTALAKVTLDSGCQTQQMHFGSDGPASGHGCAAFSLVTGLCSASTYARNQEAPHTGLSPPCLHQQPSLSWSPRIPRPATSGGDSDSPAPTHLLVFCEGFSLIHSVQPGP